MKNILKYLFLIVAAACLSGGGGTICAANQQSGASGNTTEALAGKPLANDNAFNTVAYRSLPALTVGGKEGVSAPFAGMSKGSLLVAGGCNFPGKPAAEGGEKVFYRDIYELENPASDKSNWKKAGQLPEALAYGVAVPVPEGLVCIGGTNGKESSAKVFLLEKLKGGIKCVNLPALPQALDNMAGAIGGGYIYVAGGQTNGASSRAAYRLSYPHATRWERLPDIPGAARLQPAAAVQSNGVTNCFYLMGGFQPANASHPGFANTDGLVFNPHTKQWSRVAEIIPHGTKTPMTLVGAAALTSGCAHIIFVGGVNRDIFQQAINRPLAIAQAEDALLQHPDDSATKGQLETLRNQQAEYMLHPAPWYCFNDELLIYHTITDTWVTESRSPFLARAGAALVGHDGEWIVVGGESKPGVRSADVTAIKMTMRPSFGWGNWTVLIAYLVAMILLGYYFMKREGDADDFFKGGGRIPWWAAGISIYATMLSAITYMAYPAKAYATDWTYYPMLVTILLVSFPVIKYYLPFFRRLNVTSAYEYLERRFNATTRLIASALFIIFMVARMALVLYLPSLALTAVTGIDLYICIILMALVTIVYCTMGGVEAVVWGDVVQGIILVGGALFAVGYLVFGTEGGVSGFLQLGSDAGKFRLFDWSFDYRSATFWVIILGGMANNLISYTSDQTVIQRYLTTKDERSARQSIMLNGLMSVFISIAFFAIGAGLYTFFKTHPAELDYTMLKGDTIFPFFMMSQLPQGLAGLLIAAIFAATMSTISSNINSVATAFSVDFYKRWRPQASSEQTLKVARRTCIVSGAIGMGIALLMATWEILSLLDFFQEILGLLSSGLGGLFLMGIFFPRIGGKAALTGFLSGVCVVFLVKNLTPTSFLLYGFIGLVTSVLVGLIFSYIFKEEKNLKGLCWKQLDADNAK